jgi:predicted porin
MKKTLIALAALAAAGASFAQTTVYGKLDAGLVNTAAGGTKVGFGGYETSRFGIKGEEKAGSLTLSAQLEGKVYADGTDGQAAFVGFNRTATVGVSGSFGTVTIGNQWTPFDNAAWTTDALEYSSLTPLAAGMWNYDVGNTGMGNAKGSVQYATPVISGFQGIVLSAPNVKGNTQGATNYSGIGLNYGSGPLVVNFATQAYSGDAAGNTATVNSTVLAVNFDFGMAKAYGGVFNTDSGTTTAGKDTGYTVGLAIPFGADSLRVGYGSNKTSKTGLADDTHTAWGAMYLKPLSKAAMGYAGVGSVDSANTATAGIRYNF